jgi:hypothetical protein
MLLRRNTCGLASSPCTVDITRSGDSANAKPGIPNAQNNQLFCVQAGTSVVRKSSNKTMGSGSRSAPILRLSPTARLWEAARSR